jgi:hypothetical protein
MRRLVIRAGELIRFKFDARSEQQQVTPCRADPPAQLRQNNRTDIGVPTGVRQRLWRSSQRIGMSYLAAEPVFAKDPQV